MRTSTLPDSVWSDPTIAPRWTLEPTYPAVTPVDGVRCELLEKYLAEGSVFTEMLGIKLEVTKDLPGYLAFLILNQAYEHGDLELIRKHVGDGGRALVLGAGLGVIGTALAQQTKNPVALVDANPALEQSVKKTAALNLVDLWFEHGAIVPGKDSGEISFTVSAEFWASSLRNDTYLAEREISAPILAVPALIQKYQPTTLFVDIEGAEVGLFKGLDLPGVTTLFVEIHRPNIGNEQWARVIADVHALGFSMVDAAGLTCVFKKQS